VKTDANAGFAPIAHKVPPKVFTARIPSASRKSLDDPDVITDPGRSRGVMLRLWFSETAERSGYDAPPPSGENKGEILIDQFRSCA